MFQSFLTCLEISNMPNMSMGGEVEKGMGGSVAARMGRMGRMGRLGVWEVGRMGEWENW